MLLDPVVRLGSIAATRWDFHPLDENLVNLIHDEFVP
jgi:hypothetical protein